MATSSTDDLSPNLPESSPESFILVVDDEPANLSLLKETLSSTGFKIRVITSGEKALEIIQKQPPILILLDVSMPGIDGFETCRLIKSDPSTANIPVIFATASSETSHKLRGFALGAVDYITKPFQVDEILARVKAQLRLQQLASQLRHQNQQLEQEIAARISTENALQETNCKLEQSLKDLRHTQAQLIQTEKMSSLGQLVAGVAHEINNPVNFIYGNLEPAQNYCQSLIALVNRYRQAYPNPCQEIREYIDEIDLAFLEDDLPKILKSVNTGTERLRQIVLSLKNFSRLDEADMKAVDIHEGIDSTLLILHNRLKHQTNQPAIQVKKHYGDLPLIECYPSELNQVFMNILANAIEAIEECNHKKEAENLQGEAGKIEVITKVANHGHVIIHISDNGAGIPEKIRSKLFDPFFTTKPVGKGTGLGLSISYHIITEKHGGHLTCNSILGQGTLFTITLPVSHSPSGNVAAP